MPKPTRFGTIAGFYEYVNKHDWVLVNEGTAITGFERQEGAVRWETYVTPSGSTSRVLLSDDSVIRIES